MKLGIFAFTVALLGMSAATLAQQPSGGGAGSPPSGSTADYIKSLDKDKDGMLNKTEVASEPMAADFEKIDTNKDGKLVAKEMDDFLVKLKAGGGSQPAAGGQAPAGGQPPTKQ